MTKREIIEDVAGHYNLGNRSTGNPRTRLSCVYKGDGDRRCAVGRFVKPERLQEVSDWESQMVYSDFGTAASRMLMMLGRGVLREEVQGIDDYDFWDQLQRFHDSKQNWNDSGLTACGQEEKEQLLLHFAE